MNEIKGIEKRTISLFWLLMIIAIISFVVSMTIVIVLLTIIYPDPSEVITMTAYEWEIQKTQWAFFSLVIFCSVIVILSNASNKVLRIMRIEIV